jgi:hypothetical protein
LEIKKRKVMKKYWKNLINSINTSTFHFEEEDWREEENNEHIK